MSAPERIFETTGNRTLCWIVCENETDWDVLLDAVLEDIRAPEGIRISACLSEFDQADPPVLLTDCPDMKLGALLLAADVIDLLEPFLTKSGYFIEIDLDAPRRYRLFICDRVIDALDMERSEIKRFSTGNIWHVYRPEFHRARLEGADVFKIDGIRGQLFVSERFVAAVENHGLIGFNFRAVWSSGSGGIRSEQQQLDLVDPAEEKAMRQAARRALAQREGGSAIVSRVRPGK